MLAHHCGGSQPSPQGPQGGSSLFCDDLLRLNDPAGPKPLPDAVINTQLPRPPMVFTEGPLFGAHWMQLEATLTTTSEGQKEDWESPR